MSYKVDCEEIAYGVFEFKPVKKEQEENTKQKG